MFGYYEEKAIYTAFTKGAAIILKRSGKVGGKDVEITKEISPCLKTVIMLHIKLKIIRLKFLMFLFLRNKFLLFYQKPKMIFVI
jgi:hypothetical protein